MPCIYECMHAISSCRPSSFTPHLSSFTSFTPYPSPVIPHSSPLILHPTWKFSLIFFFFTTGAGAGAASSSLPESPPSSASGAASRSDFSTFTRLGRGLYVPFFLTTMLDWVFANWVRIWYTTCNIACICPRNGHRKGCRQRGGFDLSKTWNANDGSRIIDTNCVVRRQQQWRRHWPRREWRVRSQHYRR